MRKVAWSHALAAAIVVIGGCSSDNPVGPADDELAGRTYTLVTVNGEALPYHYPGTTHTTLWSNIVFDPTRATFVITSQHCRELPCEGANVQSQEVSGTYTRSGSVIDFREQRPGNLRFDGLIQNGGQRLLVDIMHPELGESSRVYEDQG